MKPKRRNSTSITEWKRRNRYMKRFLILLLAGMMVFSLSACGGNDSTNGGGEAETDSSASADGLGYVFEYDGVSIVIDAEATDIIEALGEPTSYYEATSCAFDGLDKIYTYSSFELDTYPTDDIDYVSAVILKDDLVSTAEGVSIGDSLEDVTAAYGEGEESNGYLVYEKDDMKLRFVIEDDVVTSIEYQTTVLE